MLMNRVPHAVCLATGCIGLFLGALLTRAVAQDFFTYDPAAVGNGFAQAPVLDNDNASEVADILSASQEAGLPVAVRVREVITNVASSLVLTHFRTGRVFADFTSVDRAEFTADTAKLALASPATRKAFVGDFNLFPNADIDPTHPASLAGSQSPRFQVLPMADEFKLSRGKLGKRRSRQAAMPALFPGSPDFRNPAQGNSGAPNIRAALFTLPIQRFTLASQGLRGLKNTATNSPGLYTVPGIKSSIKLLPIVARFNNYGNPALGGGPNGTGFVQNAANPANGQLLSRGDFQAMVVHLRFRGADGAVLFDGTNSVIGYTASLHRDDIVTGWNASTIANDIFVRRKYSFANL